MAPLDTSLAATPVVVSGLAYPGIFVAIEVVAAKEASASFWVLDAVLYDLKP